MPGLKRTALASACLSALAACAFTHAVVLDPTLKLSPICPDGVALFTTFDRIAEPFREVALLDAWGTSDDVTNTMLYQAQRKKAASLGANAVIVGTLREPTTLGNLLETSSDQRRSAATAIYIPADTQRVRVACAARQ